MTEAAEFQEAFDDLRTISAPSSLAPAALARVGLADWYFRLDDAPVHPIFVAYNDRGVSAVMREDTAAGFEHAFRRYLGRPASRVDRPPAKLVHDIVDQLRGTRRTVQFDLRGLSEFEQAVLRKALDIPRGEVRPYAWVAREIGRPRAVRAVGSALAGNPIPLLIPCHRVVQSTGKIGNYGLGGPSVKRNILQWEGANMEEAESLARAGIRFIGSRVDHTYCFPTCGGGPSRLDPQHRRPFHSAAEAAAAGFRPCADCRPAPIASGQ
jgi:O-6-methylguanine DNA methyltransferase